MLAKLKSMIAAAFAWARDVALPALGHAGLIALRALWAGVLAVAAAIRSQGAAAGSTPGTLNLIDVRKAAAGAAFAPGIVGVFMSILIVGLHGFAALLAILPLGLLGTVILFVTHFVTILAVRLNHGYDPLGGPVPP
jgi:hypothetical protein